MSYENVDTHLAGESHHFMYMCFVCRRTRGFPVARPSVCSRFSVDAYRACLVLALRHTAVLGGKISHGFVVHVSGF